MYKNYGKIKHSLAINAPYKEHNLKYNVGTVPDKPNQYGSYHFGKSKFLGYMTYHKGTEQIFVTDRQEIAIKSFKKDLNPIVRKVKVGKSIKYYNDIGQNPGGALKKPVPICTNSLGHLFVGDHKSGDKKTGSIFVYKINEYEENKDDIENFETINTIEHDLIRTPSCMEIEGDVENGFRLYVTDWFNSNLTVWKLNYDENGNKYEDEAELLHIKDIITPSLVRVSKSNILVISEVSWDWKYEGSQVEPGERKIMKVKEGLNAIYVFDKLTFKEKHVIKFNDFFNPRGLYVDSESNIYTTAYKLSERKNIPEPNFNEFKQLYLPLLNDQTNRVQVTANFHSERYNGRNMSDSMYLVIMDMKGNVLQHTDLGIECIGDFLVFDKSNENKIVFMSARGDPSFNLIEFQEPSEL